MGSLAGGMSRAKKPARAESHHLAGERHTSARRKEFRKNLDGLQQRGAPVKASEMHSKDIAARLPPTLKNQQSRLERLKKPSVLPIGKSTDGAPEE